MHPAVARDVLTREHGDRLRRICRFVPSPGPAPAMITEDDDGVGRLPIVQDIAELLPQALEIEVLVTSWGCPKLDRETIESLPRLRLIAHMGDTVKGFIDDLAWRRGILVSHAAAAAAIPVAEYALAAILLANKGAFVLERRYASHRDFDPSTLHGDPTHRASVGNYQRTVGVIGASHVGRKLLGLLAPRDLKVVLYDPYIAPSDARALGAVKMGLNEVLAKSDVVSLHAPLLEDTHHLIGASELAQLRDGATLINTAQGALIDPDALEAELLSGRLNAILDVTEPQPLVQTSPLFELPNVFLTPQLSGSLGAEIHRFGDVILDELERYARGAGLKHLVRRDQLARMA